MKIKTLLLNITILSILQFPILTGVAMWAYPGGTIHNPQWESYSLPYNYFSDLGRTQSFDRADNSTSHLLFKTSLMLVGIGTATFMLVVPFLFSNRLAKALAILAMVFGLGAAYCYVMIGQVPWNESYRGHRYYVTRGFCAFLLMSVFLWIAILNEAKYPRKYGQALGVFCLIAFVQVCIMLMGPRAYHTNEALLIQAVAQKITVFAELFCMLYLAYGVKKDGLLSN